MGEKKDEALANVPKSNANILLLTLIVDVDVDVGWLHGSHYGRIICPAAKMFYYQTNVLHDFAFSLLLSISLSLYLLLISFIVRSLQSTSTGSALVRCLARYTPQAFN